MLFLRTEIRLHALIAVQTVGRGAISRCRAGACGGRKAGPQLFSTISLFSTFLLANLYPLCYSGCRLNGDFSALRQKLWRAYRALPVTLRALQRDLPMVQGSFYRLRRKCGKPNCRCARGQLHESWVITRSEQGKDRIYVVPADQRAQLRAWTAEYRRYQRARAVLVKRHLALIQLVDQIAQRRLRTWPTQGAPTA